MKCQGNFKYKGLEKRAGGKFTNAQGEVIEYNESYSLKVDEQTDNGIYERHFKVAVDSPLVDDLKDLELYDDVELEFDVKMYGSRFSVIPVAILS